MKLYGYWRSSSAWRVRILLHFKGAAFEYVPVNLLPEASEQRGEAHRRRNPMAQIPTLEWEEGGEVRRLSQSMAIADLLESRFPDPPLFPADPYLRARAIQLAEIVNSGIQPLQNTGTLGRLRELDADPDAWARAFIAKGLSALDAEARAEPYGYLVGETPTVADAFLVPQLYNARRFGVDLAPFGRLLEVERRCASLPAFVAAHPEKQIDKPIE
jgi:maleylpyruvate isomerase